MLQFSSLMFFSSRDGEDACDSIHIPAEAILCATWSLAKSPVCHQSQGQPWAHVPCFYSDGLSPLESDKKMTIVTPKENMAEGILLTLRL